MAKDLFKRNEWHQNRRVADGMTVEAFGAGWVIYSTNPDDKHRPLTSCPCCNRHLATAEIAQVCADAYYPVAPGDSAWVTIGGVSILD